MYGGSITTALTLGPTQQRGQMHPFRRMHVRGNRLHEPLKRSASVGGGAPCQQAPSSLRSSSSMVGAPLPSGDGGDPGAPAAAAAPAVPVGVSDVPLPPPKLARAVPGGEGDASNACAAAARLLRAILGGHLGDLAVMVAQYPCTSLLLESATEGACGGEEAPDAGPCVRPKELFVTATTPAPDVPNPSPPRAVPPPTPPLGEAAAERALTTRGDRSAARDAGMVGREVGARGDAFGGAVGCGGTAGTVRSGGKLQS